ncbi:MAG: hypothetical protein ACM3N0_06935 [Chloroflexota bacterium]
MKRSRNVLIFAAIAVLGLALPGIAAAKARDRNHDRIPDRWEKRHHLSLKVNQARRDQDHDHLRNRAEFQAGTNPRNPDSDGDGIPDGEEHAGKIQSFDPETGTLVISLFGGGSISGLVTGETEIECKGGAEASASDSSGDEESEDGESGGDEESEDGESGGDEGRGECTTADLVPGATVDEAELQTEEGVAVFEKVELDD